MRQFIDEMRASPNYFYLQSSLFDLSMEPFSQCLDIARHCEWGSLISNNLLIGSKGTKMALHCEHFETMLFQCHGYSEIVLFAPECALNLYPFPYGHPHTNKQSMADAEFTNKNPSFFKKFNPSMNGAMYCGVLEAGDVLFIPCLWWWELTNLNDFSSNIQFLFQSATKNFDVRALDVEQIKNEKTSAQMLAIGRNLEKMLVCKYGSMSAKILKSFADKSGNEDEKYKKYRNDIRRCLQNVFNEADEIDKFIADLVQGRYDVDCTQFV